MENIDKQAMAKAIYRILPRIRRHGGRDIVDCYRCGFLRILAKSRVSTPEVVERDIGAMVDGTTMDFDVASCNLIHSH